MRFSASIQANPVARVIIQWLVIDIVVHVMNGMHRRRCVMNSMCVSARDCVGTVLIVPILVDVLG